MKRIILVMVAATSAVLTTFNSAQSAKRTPPIYICASFKVGLNHRIPEHYRCASDATTAQNWDKLKDPSLYKEICHGENLNDPDSGAPNCHEMIEGYEDSHGNSIGGWSRFEGCPPASGPDPVVTANIWCGPGHAYGPRH